MAKKTVKVNRAPVLTLWAAIVAERLGYDHKTALTLGKAVAGLNAQVKGQRLGIFAKAKDRTRKVERRAPEAKEAEMLILLGRPVPTIRLSEGVRATIKGEVIDPQSVEKYLLQKFGKDLNEVKDAMEELARAFKPSKLATEAYRLYEKFRPNVPEGEKGWGAKGKLDFGVIRSLAR